jgi:putative Mg2+ transporter-C (MgtC) family protein
MSLLEKDASPTRIAAQVVSGIGFLGGGVILREGLNVKGMNTAATLWCSAAVGSLVGAGHLSYALVGTAAVLLTHVSLRPVVRRVDAWSKTSGGEVETLYRVRVVCERRDESVVRMIFTRHVNAQPHMNVMGLATQQVEAEGQVAVVAEIQWSAGSSSSPVSFPSAGNALPSQRAATPSILPG